MRLIDYNPLTGEQVTFSYDHANDQFQIGHIQDCTPIIEDNKRAIIENDHQKQVKKGRVHYARIPNVVIMKWKQELGVDVFNRNHKKKVMQLLEDPDWKYLKRTTITHDR